MLKTLAKIARGDQIILSEYRVDPVPRYGWGRESHPELLALIESGHDRYRTWLEKMASVPVRPGGLTWSNQWLPALDSVALYCLTALLKPQLYLEVGSGTSTRIVRASIEHHKLPTRIVSIDPHPRAEIDKLCDEVIRKRLEDAPLEVFARLQPGDILFVDNSHRSFPNSDVTVFFLEVLPRLRPGVLIGLHDICLPNDYPPPAAERFYSEQYLLACVLLFGDRFQVELPFSYLGQRLPLLAPLEPVRRVLPADVNWNGTSFWIRRCPVSGFLPNPSNGAQVERNGL